MPTINENVSRLERIEKLQDQQGVLIADVRRSQDRMDVIFTTFIDEMKALKAKDVDISILLEQHESNMQGFNAKQVDLQTLIRHHDDGMRDLKEKDIDLQTLIQQHNESIKDQTRYWKNVFGMSRWFLALLVSIVLLFLGTLIAHFFL